MTGKANKSLRSISGDTGSFMWDWVTKGRRKKDNYVRLVRSESIERGQLIDGVSVPYIYCVQFPS